MSNSNFLPGPIPSFINFNNYSVKNAYNESLSAVDANDIDTSFFTMIKPVSLHMAHLLIFFLTTD